MLTLAICVRKEICFTIYCKSSTFFGYLLQWQVLDVKVKGGTDYVWVPYLYYVVKLHQVGSAFKFVYLKEHPEDISLTRGSLQDYWPESAILYNQKSSQGRGISRKMCNKMGECPVAVSSPSCDIKSTDELSE